MTTVLNLEAVCVIMFSFWVQVFSLILAMPLAQGSICLWLMNIIVSLWLTVCCVCFERCIIKKSLLSLVPPYHTEGQVSNFSVSDISIKIKESVWLCYRKIHCFIELKVKLIDLRVMCGKLPCLEASRSVMLNRSWWPDLHWRLFRVMKWTRSDIEGREYHFRPCHNISKP